MNNQQKFLLGVIAGAVGALAGRQLVRDDHHRDEADDLWEPRHGRLLEQSAGRPGTGRKPRTPGLPRIRQAPNLPELLPDDRIGIVGGSPPMMTPLT